MLDVFPTPESYGWLGTALMFCAYVIIILMYMSSSSIELFFILMILFVLGGFCGREFEKHRSTKAEIKRVNEAREIYEKRIQEKEKDKTNK